jgi:hypothetical protein
MITPLVPVLTVRLNQYLVDLLMSELHGYVARRVTLRIFEKTVGWKKNSFPLGITVSYGMNSGAEEAWQQRK